jgi:hypothetical protein
VESIKREKLEAEKKYGIRIAKTDISCAYCGNAAGFFHVCSAMPPERKEEIIRIKKEFERPSSLKSIEGWREELGIKLGMSKEEAFEKFRTWRESKRTCQRCEGEKLAEYCPVNNICKEADENVRGNDDRDGTAETSQPETVRANLLEERKRAPVR